ncbi:MAG: hypothetical protein GTN40_00140 [Candidatus Aenigmarchaeota archaeon]|nr:hypothetical protein [Candidatus Aenigmarchaeota archaeon]
MILNLFIFLIAFFILVKSAQITVKSLERIAIFFGFSEFSVGFILMAAATSIPELFVGVSSAFSQVSNLSLGNIIGANIVDLTLVGGTIAFILGGVRFEGKIERRETIYMVIIALLPILMLLDKELSRFDGFILVLVYLIYILNLLREKKSFKKVLNDHGWRGILKAFFLFIVGFLGLILGARLIVIYGISIATSFSIPLVLIGLLAISMGTTLPELAFEFQAVKTGHQGMALGDLLGSVVTNSAFVLGIVALIQPIVIKEFNLFLFNAGFLVVVLFVFAFFASRKSGLTRMEGLGLLVLYILFFAFNLAFWKL